MTHLIYHKFYEDKTFKEFNRCNDKENLDPIEFKGVDCLWCLKFLQDNWFDIWDKLENCRIK